ncbi:MAG: hypothetical protein AAF702_24540 [Chloroflexota bacterium]
MNRLKSRKVVTFAFLAVSLLLLTGCGPMMHRMMHHFEEMHRGRMGEMRRFGEQMMPFGHGGMRGDGHGDEMRAVSQAWEKSENGVLFQVMANDAEDTDTITEIQERLAEQVEQMTNMEEMAKEMAGKMEERMSRRGHRGNGFREDGFGGRGLSRLSEFIDRVEIEYSDLDDGGQIAITSDDAEVVEMLHSWIDGEGRRGESGRRSSSL